ncbi:GH1 family beta-glucosidase [Deinococcus deserti]|uniref:Beta-glucosidase n=1 Tax=Deinococcus deserti (strain DSM 17065 / CIP 109153 / LMG 22923 / VCD115) TaxID=546414 RepID=C1CXP6_DEIDV|nr:GH1 family beta-glucosidase [Deinococcus deserti]ACO44852.1 putative Beta-glucosidase [Deinococcus deserti VCD115]
MTLTRKDFPNGFIFGTATSSYQIEGAASEDGRGPSIWDTFCRQPGRIQDGTSGDVACDHYHLWPEDLDLLRELGVDAYRFSLAWPRIQPSGSGAVNEKGLEFYDRLVDGLLERGIQPYATLYHWDLPQPLQDIGGWANREVAHHFADYAALVAGRLGDRVRSIATLNEPWCSSFLSYDIGEHAPGLRDRRLALAAAHHLLLGHGQAVQAMRALGKPAELGLVLNLTPAYPASQSAEDARATQYADGYANRWFLDPVFRGAYPQDMWDAFGQDVPDVQDGDLALIREPLDFLGVNYYTRSLVSAQGPVRPQDAEYTHMHWEVYPQGLTDLLLRLQREYPVPPMYITENGAAYPDERGHADIVHDPERLAYYQRHLAAVIEATRQGADVRGYFAWSMLDNFEWAYGYSRRFGLFYVDYQTQERTWKDSGRWFQGLMARTPVAAD